MDISRNSIQVSTYWSLYNDVKSVLPNLSVTNKEIEAQEDNLSNVSWLSDILGYNHQQSDSGTYMFNNSNHLT
jgi:hypothetical protein